MDQCLILYVRTAGRPDARAAALRSLGFRVDEWDDLPSNEAFASCHAVVIHAAAGCDLPMLAARLRAKPYFGRRVLLAIVAESTAPRDKREATLSGFDQTLTDTCGGRDLAAAILRLLRPYPEYRCVLRSPSGRRKAA